MLEILLLGIGIAGFSLAGYWDLRYTEFPDWLPYSMIIFALLFRGIFAFLENDWWILGNSVIAGGSFLALGLLLYFAKQWGDGDAWLLGALGFLFPERPGFGAETFFPFPLTLLLNFLFISLVYLVIYSLVLGFVNKGIGEKYTKRLEKEKKRIAAWSGVFFAISWGFAFLIHIRFSADFFRLYHLLLIPFIFIAILLFSYYAKIVEEEIFRKRIKTTELKEGDVVLGGRWRGLTADEIERLKKKTKYVWVKEGVRFAPVFVFTMLISIFYGDLIIILI